MIEVRSLGGRSQILADTKGAFVNIVTWACDAEEYVENAKLVIGDLGGMYVSEVINPEPVEARRAKRGGDLEEEIEDMLSRAQANSKAIIYGTFHTFEKDDA